MIIHDDIGRFGRLGMAGVASAGQGTARGVRVAANGFASGAGSRHWYRYIRSSARSQLSKSFLKGSRLPYEFVALAHDNHDDSVSGT